MQSRLQNLNFELHRTVPLKEDVKCISQCLQIFEAVLFHVSICAFKVFSFCCKATTKHLSCLGTDSLLVSLIRHNPTPSLCNQIRYRANRANGIPQCITGELVDGFDVTANPCYVGDSRYSTTQSTLFDPHTSFTLLSQPALLHHCEPASRGTYGQTINNVNTPSHFTGAHTDITLVSRICGTY